MAGFDFRLAKVQQIRQRERDLAGGEVARVQQAQAILSEQITAILAELTDLEQQRHAAIFEKFDIQKTLDIQRYQVDLLAQQGGLEAQLKILEAERQRRLAILIEAEKKLKALEKLKEKQLEEWNKTQQQKFQNALDEFATRRIGK